MAWLTCTSVKASSFLEFYNPSDADQKHLARQKEFDKEGPEVFSNSPTLELVHHSGKH